MTAAGRAEIIARVLDAALAFRRITMRYDSASSQRIRDYIVEPLRLSYACGGLYLTAWVPAYRETRTFAMDRVRTLAVLDEHFAPHPLPPEPFANSLGVHTGSPELVELEFAASTSDYIAGREWHRSQEVLRRDDGSLLLRLCVCNDIPLRSWILSFGPRVRVVSPTALAQEIAGQLDAARQRYLPVDGTVQVLERGVA